jgi:hypothetical protein
MSVNDLYAKPLSLDELLQFKTLELLPPAALDELTKIERLDVSDFYEEEVRTFVIDPIVRLLGYDKGTDFSVDLGRPVEFLNKKKFPDYKFHLWRESFWLIEAKRPLPENAGAFGYSALAQAIEYAIHPNINAALVVLCDGIILEIFDREVNVTEPILHVDRVNLRRDFDKIRALLEPMQVWFFQKRRVVRLIDKVFDKEFNLQRVEEFRALIDRRLTGKRPVVLENFRRNVKPNDEEQKAYIRGASTEELVDVHFFYPRSIPLTHVLIDSLVSRCEPSSFWVLQKIFPDHPRDLNDTYMACALTFLIALGEKRTSVEWFPAWLVPGQQAQASVEHVAQRLLKSCLTCFEDDPARKVIVLATASLRRIFKLIFLSNETQWRMGDVMHFLGRYNVPELSWGQIVASPQGHLISMMDARVMSATHHFMASCRAERGEFKTEVGKLQLRELWNFEKKLLANIDNYPQLCKERNMGEGRMTEAAEVTYDLLGHDSLCLLSRFPRWTTYALQELRSLIETLASMNSWKAKELLGIKPNDDFTPASDDDLAARFFYGDVAILQALRAGYTRRIQ